METTLENSLENNCLRDREEDGRATRGSALGYTAQSGSVKFLMDKIPNSAKQFIIVNGVCNCKQSLS